MVRRLAPPTLTGGEGFTFEDMVTARYLAALLCDHGAPGTDGAVVIAVAQQQGPFGQPLDDVIVRFRLAGGGEGRLSVQVKTTLTLSDAARNENLRAIVRDSLKTLQAQDFRKGVDRVGAATRDISAKSWRDINTVTSWARSSAHSAAFAARFLPNAPASTGQRKVHAIFRTLLSRAQNAPCSDNLLHDFFRHFIVLSFTYGDDDSEAINAIRPALRRHNMAGVMWTELCHLARTGSSRAQTATRPWLIDHLIAKLPAGTLVGPTLRRNARGDAVKTVQTMVGVSADGIFGPATEAAVRAFQRANGAVPDGIVGPKTWLLIDSASILEPVPSPAPSPSLSPVLATIVPVRLAWGKKVSSEFRNRVIQIGKDLSINPDYLMACMAFETGETFSPIIRNVAASRATGLIQFTPAIAKELEITIGDLAGMTAEDQLEYVKKYFLDKKGPFRNLGDIYMAILWPAGIGKPDSYPLFKKGGNPTTRYDLNIGADREGIVTRGDACAAVQRKLEEGLEDDNLFVGT